MSRSSQLNLYAQEDVSDNLKKFQVEVSNADIQFAASSTQDIKFDFKRMKMKGDGEGAYWDVVTRFADAESDIAANLASASAAITALQLADATEQNARISGDTSLQNAVDAEVAARVAGDNAIAANLTAQIPQQHAHKAAATAARAQEVSDRQAAVAAEAALRVSDVAALTATYNALLSNTDPAAIDSLTECIAAYTAGDTALATQAAGILTRLGAVETLLNSLVNAGL